MNSTTQNPSPSNSPSDNATLFREWLKVLAYHNSVAHVPSYDLSGKHLYDEIGALVSNVELGTTNAAD